MVKDNLGFKLPLLDDFIELNPLTVDSKMLAIDAISLMNQPRQINLNEDRTENQYTNRDRNVSRLSYVLVLEEFQLVGILTERDIVKLSAIATDLRTVTIAEVMTKNLITLKKSNIQDVYQIISILRQNNIRHLPVVSDFGELEGIISSDGIGKALNPSNLLKLRSVADVMKTNILQVTPTTSVLRLSQLMLEQRQSCVIIVENRSDSFQINKVTPLGIVTERDIVQLQILGLDLANTLASTVMSTPLVCMKPTDSLLEVQQKMKKLRVRRLVITGYSDQFQGIITLEDMLAVFNTMELYSVISTLKQELDRQTQHLQEEIKQRQKSENVLQKNQKLLELFVRYAPAAIAMLDREMRYLAVSDRWITDYQLKDEDIIGQTHYDVFPEITERWEKAYQEVLTGKIDIIKSEEDSFKRLDGRVDWLRWELRPWRDPKGEIAGILMFSEVITERKLLEEKLYSSEAQMRGMFEAMNDFVFTIDIINDSIQILPTKFFEQNNCGDYNLIIEKLQIDLLDSAETEYYRSLNEQIIKTQETFEFEYSLKLENEIIWFSVNISAISQTEVIWMARDVTHRRKMEQNLFAEKELAKITLQSIADAVITTDALGKVEYLNPIAEQLTGCSTPEVRGKTLDEFLVIVDRSTREPVSNPVNLDLRDNKISLLPPNTLLIAKDGTEYAIEDSAAPIKDRSDRLIGIVIVFRDVTESYNLAQKLSWQATHDRLTGLYNRRKFEQEVEKILQDTKNDRTHHVLCYLDLDRFKIVNDTCGHAAGDELLKQVTKILQQRVRNSDIFARLGGDEFGLLLYGCSLEIAEKIVEELRNLIQDYRFIQSNKTFKIGVSIGLVSINSSTKNLASVLKCADAACYTAKRNGRNCVYIYTDRDNIIVKQQGEQKWFEKLNLALEENRFCLYTQKIIDISSKNYSLDRTNSCYYEILLRLIDESEKLIAPGVFIPIAERYDLMPTIDRWVVSTFLANYELYCQSRKDRELPPPKNLYTINLSGASINNRDFSSFLQEQLNLYNIPSETICFEITETVAITNFQNAINLIEQLKKLGCSIALDDFGSGMCSFGYLKNLPVDYLKIDGSFIKNIASDRVNYATVECFNHISQIMEIRTIAEFVEDDIILQKLQQIGINYAQGYGIEKPKPLSFNVAT